MFCSYPCCALRYSAKGSMGLDLVVELKLKFGGLTEST